MTWRIAQPKRWAVLDLFSFQPANAPKRARLFPRTARCRDSVCIWPTACDAVLSTFPITIDFSPPPASGSSSAVLAARHHQLNKERST